MSFVWQWEVCNWVFVLSVKFLFINLVRSHVEWTDCESLHLVAHQGRGCSNGFLLSFFFSASSDDDVLVKILFF